MKFNFLSIPISYLLCGKLWDYFTEIFTINSPDFFKFLAYALGAGFTQWVYNIGYQKYRDRKNNEVFYAEQKIQKFMIEQIVAKSKEKENRIARLEGKCELYDILLTDKIKV